MPLSASGKAVARLRVTAVHVGSRLLDRHAGPEPADAVDSQSSAALKQQRIAPLRDGHVHVSFAEARNLQVKIRRDDAHDGVVPGIQSDALSQDVRSRTKLALP